MERILSYGQAINEALTQAMEKDPTIYIIGQGADDPTSAVGPLDGIQKKFPDRIMDVPMSEDAVTGTCIGMAMNGLHPINWHIRMDFIMLCVNQIVNMASKISYMYAGQLKCPIIFRGMIGKSWGQGPQHSQSLYPLFAHIPGLKVYAPVIPLDAKNVYMHVLTDKSPSIIMEHRLLYYQKGEVPDNAQFHEFRILKKGEDITLIGVSQMAVECLRAAKILEKIDINAEVICPVELTISNFSIPYVSVEKTKNLLVVDNDWTSFGFGSEIIASLHETEIEFKSKRMGFEPVVCPTSPTLEKIFYPNPLSIAKKACFILEKNKKIDKLDSNLEIEEIEFKGPF
jgi:pyruvate/2-oxoglutarate/acetoin dehydrogenase E1 component